MWSKISNYLKELLSNSSEASSKRLLSIASFVVLIVYIFTKQPVESVLYVLVGLILGTQTLTILNKNEKEW